MNWLSFRAEFDVMFASYIEKKVNNSIDIYGERLRPLVSYIQEYIKGGKRFRPYMVYLWYHLVQGDKQAHTLSSSDLMHISLINELIHVFALIHDDIVDKGETRHHIPCYHKHLATYYQDDYMGVGQAMLVGDLIYAWTIQELVAIENTQARTIIADMIEKVVAGELLDVEYSMTNDQIDLHDITIKDDLKSGQYTFTGPMLFGASLAGATDKQLADIQTIGTAVGIAFQMRDDILDRLPNDDGKTKFSDIYEGNQTIVRSLLQQHCTTEQRSAVSSYRKKLLTSSDQQYLSDIIKTHQIKQHVAKSIASYLDQAQVCVDQAEINQEYKQFFLDIMQKIRSI